MRAIYVIPSNSGSYHKEFNQDDPRKHPRLATSFYRHQYIAIGYNAWIGYLGGERGVVICSTNSPLLGMAGETYKAHFVPRKNLAAFLNAWLGAPDTVLLQKHFMNAHI